MNEPETPSEAAISEFLASLLAETRGCDWEALARQQARRLPQLLAARFAYDVEQGGFAQLLFNMKGNLLEQMEGMLTAANAKVAHEYYVRAIRTCLQNRDEYIRFIASNYVDSNPVKDELHRVSLEYFAKRVPFTKEAFSFLVTALSACGR